MTNHWLSNLSLSVDFINRDSEDLNESDEAIGRKLFMEVYQRSLIDFHKPYLLLFQENIIEKIQLENTVNFTNGQKQHFLGGMAGRKGIEFMALCAAFRNKDKKSGSYVFIEWPDNRWWLGYQFNNQNNKLISNHPIVRRAIDGDPKPQFLGSWYSLSRRKELRLDLNLSSTQTLH